MIIDPKKTQEHLTKAREVMNQVKAHLKIQIGCWVADYDGLTYKIKFYDESIFTFRNIPRKYIEDRDSWRDHADYWTALFKEVGEELTWNGGRMN